MSEATSGDDALVATPGGWRPGSQVHPVEPGAVIDGSDGVVRKLGPNGGVLAEYGEQPRGRAGHPLMPLHANTLRTSLEGEPPGLAEGWITYADWTNSTGSPITQFTTIWEVPPDPETHSGQLLYLFNGMQNSDHIYQPVLQWGTSRAGGGNFWSVATWYVGPPGGDAIHSEQAIRVNPGDALIGVMTLADQGPAGFSYGAGFFGIANSGYALQNVPELTYLI